MFLVILLMVFAIVLFNSFTKKSLVEGHGFGGGSHGLGGGGLGRGFGYGINRSYYGGHGGYGYSNLYYPYYAPSIVYDSYGNPILLNAI